MERREFLQSNILTGENIYKGFLPYHDNHLHLYLKFLNQFKPARYNDEVIQKITSDKDLIVSPYNVIVVCTNTYDVRDINTLKLHLVENFIVNWREYDKYIYNISPSENSNNLTIDSITSKELVEYIFDDKEKSNVYDIKYKDILFIYTQAYQRHKFYVSETKDLIESRTHRGLVTIVIYNNDKSVFESEGYTTCFGVDFKYLYYKRKVGEVDYDVDNPNILHSREQIVYDSNDNTNNTKSDEIREPNTYGDSISLFDEDGGLS